MLSRKSTYALLLLIVTAGVLAWAYYRFDPIEAGWMPRCIWKVATGTDCPGCGSQRMAHAIMHGDLEGAWHANAYALCTLPVILFLIVLEFSRDRYPKLYARVHHKAVILTLAFTVIAWWILRNLLFT